MQWHVKTLGPVVNAKIDALPVGLRAKLLRLMVTVQDFGLDQLREPHVKHVEGQLWELRVSAREGIARRIYVTQSGRRVVVLHVAEKKTQKTPQRAIRLAMERMKEVT